MANNHFSSPFQLIEKLAGRDNYRSWAIAMRAYLEVEELWDTIKAPANGQLNSTAGLGKIGADIRRQRTMAQGTFTFRGRHDKS